MPRRQRHFPAQIPSHIIQRGNNRDVCFTSDDDIAAYVSWLQDAATRCGVDIHAWVFMTNHVHLLATPHVENGISPMMQLAGGRYVRYFN
ncbi:MAG: transposase [Pseudomonadales bacterium]